MRGQLFNLGKNIISKSFNKKMSMKNFSSQGFLKTQFISQLQTIRSFTMNLCFILKNN